MSHDQPAAPTPEQRADAAVDEYFGPDRAPGLRAIVAAAIREAESAARADEREACAKVCDDLRHPNGRARETDDWIDATDHCAAAIRALATEETSTHGS